MHLQGLAFDFVQEGPGLFQQVLIPGLEPFDKERGVNDDLRGHTGSLGNSG